ncbi:reticulocyte-binding protein PFD0110w-like isoform X1 [Biomphalaria glabrata]|nr:reticulocyte-binding protein [Biomphalaria glabrata]
MDEFKPRSIEVLIEQAHMFGIEGDELREFVLNRQKLDLERLKDLNRQKLDLERLKLELERKAIEVVKLKMELEVKLSLQGDVNYKIEIENDILTNEEQNNCQDIDNNVSGIEDNEEIENVLSSKKRNDCNYTVNDINEIGGVIENIEGVIENVLTTEELNDINEIEIGEVIENVLTTEELIDINEIEIGEVIENVLTTEELIDKELIDCQFIDNNIIHVLRPFHRVHKPLKRLNLTKGVYQVVGTGKVKPDPNRLQMFLYLKIHRRRKKKS